MKKNLWGIDDKYEDGLQREHDVSGETKQKLLRAMGAEENTDATDGPLFIVEGSEKSLPKRHEIILEDGARAPDDVRSRELPLGYHTLRNLDSGKTTRLIVAPGECYLRESFHVWGWTLQLYALRSKASWGIGDLEDLKQVASWSADVLNAGVLMTNPLGASAPAVPQQPSPYYASSRLFRNPLYLRIEEVPGAAEALPDLAQYAARGRELNSARLIDRDAIYKLKMDALEKIWTHTRDETSFDAYEREQGSNLQHFAIYCALAESHGPNWREWSADLRDPASAAVEKFAREASDRVRFHIWVQWLIDRQLLHASERRMLMQDLPIGVDPAGADAWIWQEFLAKDVSVGAPPDPFSENGQNWGLPPFIPHKLRAAGYEPLAQVLRAAMCHSAGLRIDHAMGLFRLFWIPAGESARDGAYVRYNADEMLSIVALESVRARAFVVGEDLGTVEAGVREKLAQFRVLSYRVLWFEEDPPGRYPELSLASISTHDLPTLAGAWSGADLREQQDCGAGASEEAAEEHRQQIQKIAGVGADAPVEEVVVKAHEALAQAPSVLVLASLDDALAFEHRPNLPGTMGDQRPNWSIPLPKKLEEIETDPMVLKVAGILRRRPKQTAEI